MARNGKRQKISQPQADAHSPKICYLVKLPLELIAEISLYTGSPKHVLALARCNKFLCRTLLHETSQYIWRYVRQNCLPESLPNPCARFTESSYAAFVFDSGGCEVCGRKVDFFSSFALRMRLCPDDKCRIVLQGAGEKLYLQYSSDKVHTIFENTLPVTENMDCWEGRKQDQSWPLNLREFRYSDWVHSLQEYLDASTEPRMLEEYLSDCSRKSIRNAEFMQMCVALHSWKKKYLAALEAIKNANVKFSKELSAKKGLNSWDLMNTPAYGLLYKRKNQSLELIEQSDYNVNEAAITTALIKVAEGRSRRVHEASYLSSRGAVKKHYARLRTSKQEDPLPCLPSFRELPSIMQLQCSGQSEKKLVEGLQSETIKNLIRSDLERFHSEAKKALGEVLGYPDWKSPSSKKVHPADRLTARFRCRTCQRVEMKYKESECLDYTGAIMHMCATTLDKPVPQKPFKATRFEKDVKAVAAMSTLLEVCGIPEDEKGSHESLSAIGPRVLCLSCDAKIVLEPSAVIGHSRRHESMSLSLLSQDEANQILGDHLLSSGLATKLMASGVLATKRRHIKMYMCRHCVQVRTKSVTTGTASASAGSFSETSLASATTSSEGLKSSNDAVSASSDVIVATVKPKLSLYIFDGLRSHLKSVHKVYSIRDEDFICMKSLEWPKK